MKDILMYVVIIRSRGRMPSDVGGLLVQINMTYLDDTDRLLTQQRSGSSRLFSPGVPHI